MIRRSSLMLVFALGACEQPAPPPPPPPPVAAPAPKPKPKTATWKWGSFATNLTIAGQGLKYDAAVNMYVSDAALQVGALSLPEGTRITIEGKTLEVSSTNTRMAVPLDDRIGALEWDQLKNTKDSKGRAILPSQLDLQIAVKVEMPGWEPIEATLPKTSLGAGLQRVFIAFTKEEKHWAGETAGPAPAAAAWTLNDHFEPLGTAPLVRDVRLIVVGEPRLNSRTKKCSGYSGAKDFVATSYDLEVQLIDRVSREVVAKKNFVGQPACPQTIYATNGEAAWSEGPSYASMQQWVASQLGPVSKKLK